MLDTIYIIDEQYQDDLRGDEKYKPNFIMGGETNTHQNKENNEYDYIKKSRYMQECLSHHYLQQ
ncbi:hypothetical protein [Dickeya chrysanthemi]|uniref:Uncharacterized protein n=1 Tax=Dickeya chrysanthemi TaxID=556 RepID=A0ABU8JPX7_DICCH|nr:hypothetical protein [Dickeya chrysanthemi]MCA7007271.1 hypothetical protein [Dickeya chrysanthemi]